MTTGTRRVDPLRRVRRIVAPFGLLAMASLVGGTWGGLARVGWTVPVGEGAVVLQHGGIMVVGFLATVIGIERAVAVRTPSAVLAPAASATAGVTLMLGGPMTVAVALAIISAAAYTWTLFRVWRQQPQVGAVAMLAGAAALLAAAATWLLTGQYAQVIPWWMAFLVLTVVGERLELTRFQRVGRAGIAVGCAMFAALIAGPALVHIDHTSGTVLQGAGMAGAAGWSAMRDPARRTMRAGGIACLAGVGVLIAYTWLTAAGLLLLTYGLRPGTLSYDAVVHSFFIGFVFAAIIAHEPLIAPAVTGVDFVFSRWLYVPLVLLGVGLAGRIGGDLGNLPPLRRSAALIQALALALLLLLTARALVLGLLRAGSTPGEQRPTR